MCSPCFVMICRASSPYLRPYKLFYSFIFCFFVLVTMFTYIPKSQHEIFESLPVWMFLKINFQFEIMTLCGREIFQRIFSINSRKYSERPPLHSHMWLLFWTLIQLWFRLKCICCSCQFPLIKFSKTHARRLSHSLCSRPPIIGNSLQNLFNDQQSWAKASYFTESEHWAWCL